MRVLDLSLSLQTGAWAGSRFFKGLLKKGDGFSLGFSSTSPFIESVLSVHGYVRGRQNKNQERWSRKRKGVERKIWRKGENRNGGRKERREEEKYLSMREFMRKIKIKNV